ncbi:MAG: hypothetical protein PHP57_01135 [Sideroxydans sp.]|nr:hypothetical protein [Sideroxydans sp.]
MAAYISTPAMIPETLIKMADAVLYQAKAEGRNRIVLDWVNQPNRSDSVRGIQK